MDSPLHLESTIVIQHLSHRLVWLAHIYRRKWNINSIYDWKSGKRNYCMWWIEKFHWFRPGCPLHMSLSSVRPVFFHSCDVVGGWLLIKGIRIVTDVGWAVFLSSCFLIFYEEWWNLNWMGCFMIRFFLLLLPIHLVARNHLWEQLIILDELEEIAVTSTQSNARLQCPWWWNNSVSLSISQICSY